MKRILLLVLIVGAALFWYTHEDTARVGTVPVGEGKDQLAVARTPLDATYIIGDTTVTLINGTSEVEIAPGSASKIITRYFGNDTLVDLNDDGILDSVFFLTQETGGSGIFYYVAAALNTNEGYVGSHALFIGDRVAPQSIDHGEDGSVMVNYADRKPGESFALQPSVGKSVRLRFDVITREFGELVQDFEGEADSGHMTLVMKPWTWVNTVYPDGMYVEPQKKDAFILTIGENGVFSATTDCNSVGGKYVTSGEGDLKFGEIASTLMFCEASQESIFTQFLSEVSSYQFTTKGELILINSAREVEMVFK